MVPEGWLKTKLKKIASKIGSGVTPKGGNSSYKTEGIPLIRSQNVLWGKLDFSGIAYIDTSQHEKMRGSKVQQGDVLLNITGASIGRVAFYPYVSEANVNQHVCIIRPVEDVDPIFLRESLLSHSGQKQIDQFQAGGNRQGLNFEQIGSFKVVLPPHPEQKKIAQILSTWDQGITATERLLENSQKRKKGLMQQLLTGKKRLPGFEGEWDDAKVGAVLSVRKEKQIPSENAPLYSLTIESGITEKTDRYNREFLVKDAKEKQYKKVLPKDIVYNPANLRWGAINYSRLSHAVVVSPIYEVLYVTEPKKHCLEFIAQSLMRPDQINRFASMVEGTLMERMAVKIGPFLATRLRIPPSLDEEQAIATILTAADSEIFTLKKRLGALEQEKKALMQQLLTGKRRVNVDKG